MPMLGQTSSRRSFARINPDMPAGEIVSDFENRTSNVLSISCLPHDPGDFAAIPIAGSAAVAFGELGVHRQPVADGQCKFLKLLWFVPRCGLNGPAGTPSAGIVGRRCVGLG
jgi:hypothetical protein